MRVISLTADHPEIKIGFEIHSTEDYQILTDILHHCAADCWCKGIPFEKEDIQNHHLKVSKELKIRLTAAFYISIIDRDDEVELSIRKI